MRYILFLLLLSSTLSYSQVVDRYNFVQRPTETGITIAWRTSSLSTGTIEWGTDAFNLNNTLTESGATQKHYFDISGLTPNTKYYYQTTTDGGFTSALDFFYTAKTDASTKMTFLHYGDCGYNNTVQNDIAALMIGDSTEFGIVAGDIDQGVGDDYDGVFFGPYANLVKNACQYTCIGNHDTYADNAATYLDDFYLPSNNPQQSERYYSFTWGNGKFICLDANIDYSIGSIQHNWMLEELQCNDRQWIFMFFHQPPWTNAWSADYYIPFTTYYLYQGNEDMRTDLVPYFEQYNVDFVLNGHSHCYQRGELNGVKYIISGGAGASALDFNTNSNSPNIDTEIYANQYVRFNIEGDTATYVAIDINDVVIDSVTTIKAFTPIRPEISLNNFTLESTSGNSYMWFLDGIQINGASNQTYTPTSNGTYEVVTTNQYGCTFTSDPFEYNLLNIAEIDLTNLALYPNPAANFVQITGSCPNYYGVLELSILDGIGKIIFREKIEIENNLNHTIDLGRFSNGIYSVRIVSPSSMRTFKFIKQ